MPVFTPTFSANDYRLLADDTVYDGFFRMRRLRFSHALFAGGQSGEFSRELLERDNAVGVLLYDPQQDRVVLIEQFRVGAVRDTQSPWLLELVAGLVEAGEADAEVVMRESQEEAGLAVTALWPIGRYYSSPGGSSEQLSLFCGRVDASSAGGIHGLAEEHEDIRVHVIAVADLPALLQEGSIRNVHTAVALQWLLLNHAHIQDIWSR